MIFRFLFYILFISVCASCVATKAYEDALLVGKGNQALEGTLSRSILQDDIVRSDISAFIVNKDVGTIGLNYIYGLTDHIDVSAGFDFPVGIHAKIKYQFDTESIRSIHATSFETRVPISYHTNFDARGRIVFSAIPTYIYTYRFDDLFNVSVNSFVNTSMTNSGLYILPGLAAGIGVGDEVRFTAGLNYSRSIYAADGSRFQLLTVESSIKYDF